MTRVFKNIEEVQAWLEERGRAVPGPVVTEIALSKLAERANDQHWQVRFAGTALERIESRFFRVIGIDVNGQYGQVILDERARDQDGNLTDSSSGVLALPHATDRDAILVWTKRDPGNWGAQIDGQNTRQLLACPVQFSRANLTANPDKVPFANLVERSGQTFRLPGDGNRSLEKWNEGSVLSGTFEELQTAIEANTWWQTNREKVGGDFAWISRAALRAAMLEGWVNCHLREMVAFLPDSGDALRARLAAARIRLED